MSDESPAFSAHEHAPSKGNAEICGRCGRYHTDPVHALSSAGDPASPTDEELAAALRHHLTAAVKTLNALTERGLYASVSLMQNHDTAWHSRATISKTSYL